MKKDIGSSSNHNLLAEETFKLLIDATTEYAIFILDSAGVIQTWNSGASKIFGYQGEEIIGKHFSCLYTKDDANHLIPNQDLKSAKEKGRCEDNNACRVRKNGDSFNAKMVIIALYSTTREICYGMITQDLTEDIKAQKTLKRMEVALKLFVENTKEYAVYLMDPKGFIVSWNKGAQRIKGYSSEEIIGKHFSQFFTKDDKEKNHPQEMLKIAEKLGEYQEEGYRVRKDGSVFWAYIVLIAIRDKKGKLVNFGKISRDLTDRKNMEELLKKQNQELLSAKEEAEAANNAKSVFLSVMSHEIRTPLHSLAGMTDLLFDSPLTESQRKDLELMKSSEKQLLFVIDNILDFTKVESGPINFERIKFDLTKVINDLVTLLSFQAQKKGLSIQVSIDKEVPVYLKGDPLRVRQVLNNFLDNAIKFTSRGEIKLNVKLPQTLPSTSDVKNNRQINILFEVIDTGIGISQQVKKKLFQPFTQGDASISRKYGGSGLGLIISKKLIEGMSGVVDVESTPGKGSKFWFVIPFLRVKPQVDHNNYCQVAKRSEISETDKKNFRILLAEDNIINKQIAVRILNKFGYQADTAETGLEVLKAVENHPYDLILMDCQMPDMDGYAATQKIRHMESQQGEGHIPIVAMTANALIGDKEKCLSAGMDDYLSKPINLNHLNEILEKWLINKINKH